MSPTRFQTLSIIVSILIMGAKFLAWHLTHSNAILSDAAESVINVAAGGFALFSLYLAQKPKDRDHPYGHGKVEFLSALFEGILIGIAGLGIIGKAIHDLFSETEVSRLTTGMLIGGGAGLMNFLLGFAAQRIGKKHDSPTLIADGKHLMSDTWSSIGMLAGLLAIYFTGILWLDHIIAIIMGLVILFTGYKVLRASIGGIMDEADEELLEDIIDTLEEKKRENWIDIHNMRVIKYGPQLHVDCHLTVPWYLNVNEAHDELEEVERLVNAQSQKRVELFIHTDPCTPSQCAICEKSSCGVRQESFKSRVDWSLENVRTNRRHDISDT